MLLCETQHTHRAQSDSKMTYMLLCETQHNTHTGHRVIAR